MGKILSVAFKVLGLGQAFQMICAKSLKFGHFTACTGSLGSRFIEQEKRFPVLNWMFRCSVVSNSLRPHGPQHARPPCPPLSPRVCSSLCPSSRWCYLSWIGYVALVFNRHLGRMCDDWVLFLVMEMWKWLRQRAKPSFQPPRERCTHRKRL